MTKPEDIGRRVVRVQRPACASSRSTLPASVELHVTVPPSLEHWTRQELIEMLRGELKSIPRPSKPVGMKRIREQGIWDRPKTKAKKSACCRWQGAAHRDDRVAESVSCRVQARAREAL